MGVFVRRTSTGGPAEDAGTGPDHRQAAFRIVGVQTVVTIFFAAAVLAWWGADAGWSALAGGAICVIASGGFAARVFRRDSRGDPRRVLSAFYVGEVLKIGLTAGLFAVAIVATDLDVLVMFLAYLAATAVFWFALVATEGRQRFK